jgi:hypothetical protein
LQDASESCPASLEKFRAALVPAGRADHIVFVVRIREARFRRADLKIIVRGIHPLSGQVLFGCVDEIVARGVGGDDEKELFKIGVRRIKRRPVRGRIDLVLHDAEISGILLHERGAIDGNIGPGSRVLVAHLHASRTDEQQSRNDSLLPSLQGFFPF